MMDGVITNIVYALACIAFAVAAFWLGGIIFKAINDRGRYVALRNLHWDLGKLKWMGADEGWDLAIEAVRKEIDKRCPKKGTK